jgi:excinuclease ABC subunit A
MGKPKSASGFVRVRGARENNLKNIDVKIPRDALVVFTGVSCSGKSSLAFGTLYAEAQRRYLESVAPYARRLFDQLSVPKVDAIEGLPPAVALQQQRGTASTRSSVGTVTTLSSFLRMLFSRAGQYPANQRILYADSFSPNTPEGACPGCHGLGRVFDATEESMVPDPSKTIRERAIAAWPPAWGGQNLRDILTTLGYDVDVPWHDLPKKDREFILFTYEQPNVPVYAGYDLAEAKRALRRKEEPSYRGNFTSAKRYLMSTYATTTSASTKKRALRYMVSTECEVCHGKRLKPESLTVHFANMDIADMSRLTIERLNKTLLPFSDPKSEKLRERYVGFPEQAEAAQRIAAEMRDRLGILITLGLGYLTLERSTPTLSPGELQRLRLATQVHSNLFGVVYVLDEPSAGLHPADTEALLSAFDRLRAAGNSLFVVEHDLDVIRAADWLVDVGPAAGEQGGRILYSGPPEGLADVRASQTRRYLFEREASARRHARHEPAGWLRLRGVTRNNLQGVDAEFPLGVLTSVTGISGSGKSSLVSQALVELVARCLGRQAPVDVDDDDLHDAHDAPEIPTGGAIASGMTSIKRLERVDQRPIGRTPRSNLATYTGLFDDVRKLFASTKMARARRYDAGRFSFNVAKGRCEHCEGEGFVMVELLFMPSVYAPCPTCQGTRYNEKTLEVRYREMNIAEVLQLTVRDAADFFADAARIRRSLDVLNEVGLGYLRLGQPATELSGGEAQRIKLATELQRMERGNTLYVLDEPTTGLHPSDVDRLLKQLHRLVDAGNTVVVVEHEIRVVADSDWVIDIGPGAGEEGGTIVAAGPPTEVAKAKRSRTAPYLARALRREHHRSAA